MHFVEIDGELYREISHVKYQAEEKVQKEKTFVSVMIYIDSGCSYDKGEYSIYINTVGGGIVYTSSELIPECIENCLSDCIGDVPEEENILIEMIEDGEFEDVFWHGYLTIKNVYFTSLEILKA